MIKFLKNSKEDIKDIIQLTANKLNLPEVIIEKDLWVCFILEYLFNTCPYKSYFEFKGGTSLSKCFQLIDRFSEDIDVILKSDLLESDMSDIFSVSKSQKNKYVKEINKNAISFYSETLIPQMKKDLKNILSYDLEFEINEAEMAIYIKYPPIFNSDYIKNSVKLELGPLAAWEPHESVEIASYISNIYPDLFVNYKFNVLITKPKRTFWEKIVTIHQESHRINDIFPLRFSRHYYDLYKLYDSFVKEEAYSDLELLTEVRHFSDTFYYKSWGSVITAKPGTFRLIPSEKYIKVLEKDYNEMKSMIFSKEPPESFQIILEKIRLIEEEVNLLK